MDEWETIDWVGHDQYLAFADATIDRSAMRSAMKEAPWQSAAFDGSDSGLPFVVACTDCDDDVPIEVQRDDQNEVVAARLCWTNDVDELDGKTGEWQGVGSLVIGSGACLATNPDWDGGLLFDVGAGTYRAEAFYNDSDCLGLRITRQLVAVREDLRVR